MLDEFSGRGSLEGMEDSAEKFRWIRWFAACKVELLLQRQCEIHA
jgi:hypothetical protein